MILNKKIKIIAIISILFLSFSFLLVNKRVIRDNYSDHDSDLIIEEKVNLKSSGYWNLTGSPISIDDTVLNKSWAYTALNNDWCSGSGTWNDPYIIENVLIDGQSSDIGIEITDSSAYFIIRNCTLFNCGPSWDEPGIILDGVDNGFIINNNVSRNQNVGIMLSYSNNTTVFGNLVNNNSHGIVGDESNNNNITKNNVESNSEGGIVLYDNSNYNIIKENALKYNYGPTYFVSGIFIYNCYYNTIKENNISHCGGDSIYSAGLVVRGSHYNTVFNNTIRENGYFGVLIASSHDNTISENTIEESKWNGVALSNAGNNIISKNEVNDNGFFGIGLGGNTNCFNNEIVGNNVNNNNLSGIVLGASSNFNLILNNTINKTISGKINTGWMDEYNNILSHGIILNGVINNTVSNNLVINHNASGIALLNSGNNTIKRNILDNNTICGISLTNSFNNMISKNIASRNKFGIGMNLSNANLLIENELLINDDAIALTNCLDNLIEQNKVLRNNDGIVLHLSNNTDILRNKIYNNSDTGIILYNNSKYNVIEGNRIKNCGDYGVNISSDENLLNNNYFIQNFQNAIDDGVSNNWNNSYIGNYWDDYSGTDANNDGIGDIPYDISLAPLIQDMLPIWDENDPIIIILSPQPDNIFGVSAPPFIIKVEDHYLDTMWYTVDNGTIYVTFIENTTISQVLWDLLPEGEVTIIFYANDTLGNIGYNMVTIKKSIPESPPTIPESPPNIPLIIVGVIGGIGLASIAIFFVLKKRLKPKD